LDETTLKVKQKTFSVRGNRRFQPISSPVEDVEYGLSPSWQICPKIVELQSETCEIKMMKGLDERLHLGQKYATNAHPTINSKNNRFHRFHI